MSWFGWAGLAAVLGVGMLNERYLGRPWRAGWLAGVAGFLVGGMVGALIGELTIPREVFLRGVDVIGYAIRGASIGFLLGVLGDVALALLDRRRHGAD